MFNFKKSSFCGGITNENCVDVAISDSTVLVRNSKKHDNVIEFTHEEWRSFILGVKNQEFEIKSSDSN